MKRVDRYVLAFAVIGLVYFGVVIGVSLWASFPGGGR